MNKLTIALIVALSSSYASASDFTAWGGDLDGNYQPVAIGSTDATTRYGGPIGIDMAYASLDGAFDEQHFSAADMTSNIRLDLEGSFDVHADLDGNSDVAGDV
jgi:hypothetical protein